jgi:hypothetical protein
MQSIVLIAGTGPMKRSLRSISIIKSIRSIKITKRRKSIKSITHQGAKIGKTENIENIITENNTGMREVAEDQGMNTKEDSIIQRLAIILVMKDR